MKKQNATMEARATAALSNIMKKNSGTGFLPKKTQDQEVISILEDVLGYNATATATTNSRRPLPVI